MIDDLSNEMKVLCAIYHFNQKNEPIWLSKLEMYLDGIIDKKDVFHYYLTLGDWGITYIEYGETENGRASALFKIKYYHIERIKEIYEKNWVNDYD